MALTLFFLLILLVVVKARLYCNKGKNNSIACKAIKGWVDGRERTRDPQYITEYGDVWCRN